VKGYHWFKAQRIKFSLCSVSDRAVPNVSGIFNVSTICVIPRDYTSID